MELKERLVNLISEKSTQRVVELHNLYCKRTGFDGDLPVYDMDDLNEVLEGMEPVDIVWAVFGGGIDPNQNYFFFDGCGNLSSFDYWNDSTSQISIYAIASYIIKSGDSLGDEEIAKVLSDEGR